MLTYQVDQVKREGRTLESGSFEEVVAQLREGEKLFVVFRRDGVQCDDAYCVHDALPTMRATAFYHYRGGGYSDLRYFALA